jgi:hypothetical protein
MKWGNVLGTSAIKGTKLPDEKVGEVDCYVLTSESKGRTKTLWIGKQDFLIHQARTLTSAETMKAVMADANKRHPEIKMPDAQEVVATETHEKIVVNKKYATTDFAR